MKKLMVILLALVFIGVGAAGIFALGGKAGDPDDTADEKIENSMEKKDQEAMASNDKKSDADSSKSDSKTEKDSEDITADSEEATTAEDAETSEAETTEAKGDGDSSKADLVESTIKKMTLREKVCQMMFVTPELITGIGVVTAAGDTTRQALQDYPVGGIVYFAQNYETVEQTKEMIANSQSYSKIGLFIATDEEGGMVNRLMSTLGTTYIDSMYNYKDQGPEKAFENASTIAADMTSLGLNVDFAPVADVWSNPGNTVIGERAYSDDYAQAAELVGKAVEGFKSGGVMCTLKHFPGHGDTAEDSHYGSAYVKRTKEQIMADEMQPFKAGIDAGAEFVMVGHLTVPDIDELPATLSYKITTEMLREEMGFQGIAITDSMQMESITDNFGVGDSAVRAVEAGIDMVLQPANIATAVSAIENAVESGEITEDRIDESVRRILTLKAEKGLLK